MKPRYAANASKLALVLAGGGMTGAVYEIGALRAINDLLVDRSVTDFDIFVGTSAGAIIATFLANGFSPETMFQVIAGQHPDIPSIQRKYIFNFNQREVIRRGLGLPGKLLGTTVGYLRDWQNSTLVDAVWTLTDALPSGFYDGMALEKYMRLALGAYGNANRFDDLDRELYIIATNLDTGERAVFGTDVNSDVPISTAVAASSALPMIYKPVRIGGTEYIDGSMRGNASLDIAIEHGATLIVCINPLVPYDNSPRADPPAVAFSKRGFSAIASQVSRITQHSGLRYQIKQLRRQHPEVDIILIEPRCDDWMLAFGNIMRYAERLEIARHGFESVTLDLAEDYYFYKDTLARHGAQISRQLVIEELAEIRSSGYAAAVVEQVIETRRPKCAEGRRNTPYCRLARALSSLESELDARAASA
jgi:predicted acylesterase/phospholipase RssA